MAQETRRLTFAQWMKRNPNVDEDWQWTVKKLYAVGGYAIESRYLNRATGRASGYGHRNTNWQLNEGIHIEGEDGLTLARVYYKPGNDQPFVLVGARVQYHGRFKYPAALADKVLDLADDRYVRLQGLLQ